MSDIVERLRTCCERANGVSCHVAYGAHAEPHDMCERCHAAAEIERLRAGERAADAEIERLSALALERTEEVLRLRAAEAQRDALVRAAEDAAETLSLVNRPSFDDPEYQRAVELLGDEIGYGRLMAAAQHGWRKVLLRSHGLAGAELVAGPCKVQVEKMVAALAKAVADARGAGGEG